MESPNQSVDFKVGAKGLHLDGLRRTSGEQYRDRQFHLRDTSRVLPRAEMWYCYSISSSCEVSPQVLAAMRLDLRVTGCIHELDQKVHPTHLRDGSRVADMKAAVCLS